MFLSIFELDKHTHMLRINANLMSQKFPVLQTFILYFNNNALINGRKLIHHEPGHVGLENQISQPPGWN